jgi:hypothetical protein
VNNFSDSILDGGGGGVSCLESELKQAVKKKTEKFLPQQFFVQYIITVW